MKLLPFAGRVLLSITVLTCAVSAQQPGSRRIPTMTTEDVVSGFKSAPAPGRETAGPVRTGGTSDSAANTVMAALAILPSSDLVLEIDARQLLALMNSKLSTMAPADLMKMKQGLDEVMRKTGVDPTRLTSVAIGVNFSGGPGGKASLALIAQGAQIDLPKIMALMRAEKVPVSATTYQGVPMLTGRIENLLRNKGGISNTIPVNVDELSLASLGANGIVVGDAVSVKAMIDRHIGAQPGFGNALHQETFSQLSAPGLLRLSAVIPESVRQSMSGSQGQSAAAASPLAAVRIVYGSLDLTPDESLNIDLRARTDTPQEAAQLEQMVRGFVSQGKSMLSGAGGEQGAAIGQVLDYVQLSAQNNEVMLSVNLPKAVMNQLENSAKSIANSSGASSSGKRSSSSSRRASTTKR